MNKDYIRKTVSTHIKPENMFKQDDGKDDGEEGMEYGDENPIDWYDRKIEDVWEEDDGVYLRIQSEGGESEKVELEQVIDSLWDKQSWSQDQIEQFKDEIEDMAD